MATSSETRTDAWRERAFRDVTEPALVWHGGPYGDALDRLHGAIAREERVLLVTGDFGTGKTIVAGALSGMLRSQGARVEWLLYPNVAGSELLISIALAFHLGPEVATRENFAAAFTEFLSTATKPRRRAVLVVDEAQQLRADGLDELAWMAETFADLTVVLVGTEAIVPRLTGRGSNDVLARSVDGRCQLRPLDPMELAAYLRHGVATAGGPADAFGSDAIRELMKASGGVPRLVNRLCRLALSTGKPLNAATIVSIADEVTEPETSAGKNGRDWSVRGAISGTHRLSLRRAALVAAVVVVVGGAGALAVSRHSLANRDLAHSSTTPAPSPARDAAPEPSATSPSEPMTATAAPEPASASTAAPPVPGVNAISDRTPVAPGATERATPPAPEPATASKSERAPRVTERFMSSRTEPGPAAQGTPPPIPSRKSERVTTSGTDALAAATTPRRPDAALVRSVERPRPAVPARGVDDGRIRSREADDAQDPGAVIDWLLKDYVPGNRGPD